MIAPPLPPNEADRLRALRALHILDTPEEERFDRLTRLAARVLGTPMSMVALIDAERQWLKSATGAPRANLDRRLSFCGHTILEKGPMVVPDARKDERFHDNPIVTAKDGIRAYAGVPIFSEDGHCVGSFCVIDRKARKFDENEIAALRDLAAIAQDELTNLTLNKSLREARLAQEAAEAATRAKSDFLAVMSHEIRTPMNGVVGFTNILLGTELTYQQRDYLLTVQSCGETLVGLINDILDFSKIESGKLDLESNPVCLRRCVEDVLELNASSAAAKRLELLYEVDPAVPAFIAGDGFRLRQILTNLVGNAIKFTPGGDVGIDVGVERAPGADGEEYVLRFEVRDSGIGIPAGQVGKLFQPFSQADSSTTRKYGGTGLGLAICKRLVEMMGGDIGVQSSPGCGSIFRFTLACRALSGHEDPPFDCFSCVGKRVLIVDDSGAMRRSLVSLLSSWGCEAHSLGDGEEALALMAREPFDLVLIDHEMAGLDGAALAGRLARSEGPEAAVPRLLMASMGGREPATGGGLFHAQVRKPLHESVLLGAIAAALRGTAPGPASGSAPIPASGPAAEAEAPPAASFAVAHPLRLLVAEDNPINQRLILLLLRKLGYTASCAANGTECLAAVARALAPSPASRGDEPFDVVLMDVQMPDMDGHEVTRRLHAQARESGKRPPWVIAVTAGAMHGDRDKCLQSGMDDYLVKPLQPDALRRALERAAARGLPAS